MLRGLPHEAVLAQILLGFELASTDPRFVGLNLVMPEDWYVPIRESVDGVMPSALVTGPTS